MLRRNPHAVVAVLLLAVAGALLLLPDGVQPRPLATPLDLFPYQLPGWEFDSTPAPAPLAPDPRAPQRVTRAYRRGTQVAWVAIDYYPSQGQGRRPPARQLLFPGSGFSEITEQPVRVPLGPPGSHLDATLLAMSDGERRLAVVYWYRIGTRWVASDHWSRALVLYSRVVHRRTDGALVRVATTLPDDSPASPAGGVPTDFLQAFYPALLRSLSP